MNKLIIVFLFLAQLAYSQSTAKQGFQKIGLTGTMSNYNSVLESDAKFSTGALTLGSSTAVLANTKLKVTGNIELDNSTSTTGNIYKGGVLFLHNFGTNNNFIGFNSGNFTLTGSNNTSVGNNSLTLLTSGSQNVAIGNNALSNNTIGSFNSALGRNALNNTTGNSNTGIGYNALISNTTGFSSTAIGVNALANNTNGIENTASGQQSLNQNTTGGQNSSFGYNALYSNTTSSINTGIGYQSGYYNVTGTPNTSIGSYSLYNNIASNNIGIGSFALGNNTNITAGSFIIGTTYRIISVGTTNFTLIGAASNTVGLNFISTGVGAGTGTALSMIKGASNIAIGNNASNTLTDFTNTIAIGHSVQPTQSNQIVLGDNLITQTKLQGQVTLKVYTVATLPTGVIGSISYVSDALAPSYGVTAVGGGTVVKMVFYDGTSWKIN